jgi:hypothetical protein
MLSSLRLFDSQLHINIDLVWGAKSTNFSEKSRFLFLEQSQAAKVSILVGKAD